MKNRMNMYQQFIFKSRYARFLPEKNRREHWNETVQRYVDFMANASKVGCGYELADDEKQELYDSIYNLEVMPSMRAMMTAGKAAERDNTCCFNCAYLAVDDPKAFDEAMHILMCGTGVGFSVERQEINKLPDVPDKLFDSETVIKVKDSKEGWAKAFRVLISLLYAGEVPKWDLSAIRPAGSRLKTFGGRASGPDPLNDLFEFTVRMFRVAAGRKLNSLECHDLMCKIGEIVVVGGVRRSALISLSNLSDDRMRHAKAGAWWEKNPQRALANNSAAYTEKPEVVSFMDEWKSLYESKSGERGIINRKALKKHVLKNGRRSDKYDFGVNPCSEIILRSGQMCNLSEVVIRSDDTVDSLKRKIRVASIIGTIQSSLTTFPYLRKLWKNNCDEERLLGVSLTGIFDSKLMSNKSDESLPGRLEELREHAVAVNKEWAEKLKIPQSTAVTCVKPSGTVSQLCDCASGIHPRHSKYYFRRVRGDVKDPLTQYMIMNGIPNEPCVSKKDTTVVFTFPIESPEGISYRDKIGATDHLDLWLLYQRHWCEHKPSVTISLKEDEWFDVAAWVWKNFDEMTGVSFLPYDGGTYKQAPYEECSQSQYQELLNKIPTDIDWSLLAEEDDNVEAVQTLACSGGSCEI